MEAPIVRRGACFLTGWKREQMEGEAEVFRFYLGGQSPGDPAEGEEVLLGMLHSSRTGACPMWTWPESGARFAA
nr:hypothetical protein [uncultured Acetatifactor sp.]